MEIIIKKYLKSFLQWWVGYKLPFVHLNLTSFKKIVANLFYHPIKRRIAKCYVFILQKFFGLKVVAITGSAGKTTTKEMIASILSQDGSTVYSEGNIDPVYNIPKTILKCNFKTKYLVLEFGVEYPGEMDFYLWLVTPHVGLITNIFPTHTLFFKDRAGVLKEKSKLVKRTKICVLNYDDRYLRKIKFRTKNEVYWFKNGANLIESNVNAATTVAKVFNLKPLVVKNGIDNYQPQKHRFEIVKHKSGAVIFDDTYNSNPEALLASLKYFQKIAGNNKKIVIIGDMLELGEIAVNEHKRVGKYIQNQNFEKVFGVGKLVKHITQNIYSIEDLISHLKPYLKPNFFLFVKGSRSIGLDKLIDKLI